MSMSHMEQRKIAIQMVDLDEYTFFVTDSHDN